MHAVEGQVCWEASPDGVPFAFYHLVDPESVDIDLLAPLAQPAGSCLGSGELGEEGHERVADCACAVWLMLQARLAAGLQEWETVDSVARKVQACRAADKLSLSGNSGGVLRYDTVERCQQVGTTMQKSLQRIQEGKVSKLKLR